MDKFKKMKKSFILTGCGLLTLLVIFLLIYVSDTTPQADKTDLNQIEFSYYEDISGRLTAYEADSVFA